MELYSDWLYAQLENDGVIDTSEVSIDELSEEFLIETTELELDDLQNYKDQYIEHCSRMGVSPVIDIEEI